MPAWRTCRPGQVSSRAACRTPVGRSSMFAGTRICAQLAALSRRRRRRFLGPSSSGGGIGGMVMAAVHRLRLPCPPWAVAGSLYARSPFVVGWDGCWRRVRPAPAGRPRVPSSCGVQPGIDLPLRPCRAAAAAARMPLYSLNFKPVLSCRWYHISLVSFRFNSTGHLSTKCISTGCWIVMFHGIFGIPFGFSIIHNSILCRGDSSESAFVTTWVYKRSKLGSTKKRLVNGKNGARPFRERRGYTSAVTRVYIWFADQDGLTSWRAI